MKMIQNTLMACLFLMVAACSQTDNDVILEDKQNADVVKSYEEEDPIYAQEIMLIAIERQLAEYNENPDEYGELIEKYSYYREYLIKDMDQFSGIPGKGCPKPQPCYCQLVRHHNDGSMFAYGGFEFGMTIRSIEGEIINEIGGGYDMKCPKPTTTSYDFANPLEGKGIFIVEAYFEPAGEVMKFEAPYAPID